MSLRASCWHTLQSLSVYCSFKICNLGSHMDQRLFPRTGSLYQDLPASQTRAERNFQDFPKGDGGWVGSGGCAFASGKSAWDGETGELSAVQRYSKSWVHSTPIIWAFRWPSAGAETWPVGYAVAPTAMQNDRDKPVLSLFFSISIAQLSSHLEKHTHRPKKIIRRFEPCSTS